MSENLEHRGRESWLHLLPFPSGCHPRISPGAADSRSGGWEMAEIWTRLAMPQPLTLFLFALFSTCFCRLLYPANWNLGSPARNEEDVTFTLALRQRNLDKLKDICLEISNPKNEKYAQYLSRSEILDMISPAGAEAAVCAAFERICDSDEFVLYDFGDAIRVRASVGCVNKVFNVRLHEWHLPSGI